MEALHVSEEIDGTQFYIGCAQLRITLLVQAEYASPKSSSRVTTIASTQIYISPTSTTASGLARSLVPAVAWRRAVMYQHNHAVPLGPADPHRLPQPRTAWRPRLQPRRSPAAAKMMPAATTMAAAGSEVGTVPKYGQCGGQGWMGVRSVWRGGHARR